MNTKKRETLFFMALIVFSLLAIFVLNFKTTGYATYTPQIQLDWCNGSDINRNGIVNSADQAILNSFWGNTTCKPSSWCNNSDINRNGEVGLGDSVLFGNNLGKTGCKNLCEQNGNKCGPYSGSSATVSCLSIGLEYLGDTNLDSSCDSEGMNGCCKTKETPVLITPECGIANSSGASYSTKEEITSIINGTCSKGNIGSSGVTFSNNKWTWICVGSGGTETITCTAFYKVPATLCSQKGFTCGSVNESLNMTSSCATIKMEWEGNATLDISCNSTSNTGCCKSCSYGFDETSKKCYTSKQKCSVLKGDICNEDLESCAGTYLISSDEKCCSQTCNVKSKVEFKPKTSELRIGYNTELRKNKDTISFSVGSQSHKIEILEVTKTTATIKISSNPIEVTLTIGDIRKYDLDSNGYYDTKIKLDDTIYDDDIAEITLYSINEKISSTVQSQQGSSNSNAITTQKIELGNETETSNSWYYLVFLLVILIIFVGVLLYLAYRRNH